MSVSTLQREDLLDLVPTMVTAEQHAQMLLLAERMAGLGHWLVDLKNEALFWSDEIYRIHGVTPDEYKPEFESAIKFYHPDDVDEVTTALEKAIAEKEPFELESRLIRPSGETRIVHSKSFVQVDDSGEASAIFGIFQDVTEQRQIDAKLAAINERYEVAIHASEVGIWDVDFESRRFYFSPALHELIGSENPNESMSVEEFFERLHPSDRERAENEVLAHIKTGQKYDSEYRMRRPDCRYVWLHSTGQVIHDANGEPVRMAGSVFEIGDRKRDEQMREEVYRLLTNEHLGPDENIQNLLSIGLRYLELDIGIVSKITNDEYTIRHVEDKLGNVSSGMTFELGDTYCTHTLQQRGVTSYRHVAESDIAEHPCYKNFGLECYIGVAITVDGELYGTLNFSSPDSRERPFGAREESFVAMLAQWIAYEVRQQRYLEALLASRESLAQKERELGLIFNAVPVHIWYKDDENHILRLNRMAAESMGADIEDVEGTNAYELQSGVSTQVYEEDLAVIEAGEPRTNIVEEYTAADGRRGWLRTDKVPFEDPRSGDRRLVVTSLDITEAMEAQQALESQTELLQKTNKDLDDFAYIASHDLKAPMRGIQTLASWIEEDLGESASEETRENLALLQNRVERMDRMLADILAYSRAGKDTAEAEPVDSRELVEEVFDWVQSPEDFKLSIDGDLPRVMVPRTSLQQVFLNLVSNAIKHHDRETGKISVSCKRSADRFVFEVRDDGPGIPERFREKVFRMFETLQRRDDVESSGIGLAIVDRLVQSLGGRIELVANGDERGSCFRFTLPAYLELRGCTDA